MSATIPTRTPDSHATRSQEVGDGEHGFAAVAARGRDGDDQFTKCEAGVPGGFHSFVHALICIAFRATLALHRERPSRLRISVAGYDNAVRSHDACRLAFIFSRRANVVVGFLKTIKHQSLGNA